MSPIRITSLTNGNYYHIYSRSIAKFNVFNNDSEYSRMIERIDLCRFIEFNYKFSRFANLQAETQISIINSIRGSSLRYVDIVAFCLMPTHIHLLLKQVVDNGIEIFMGRILNSYTKSFNSSHHRSGPLWCSRFQDKMVDSNEQLLHLTRYMHLNPTSAGLVDMPETWRYSSYGEYIDDKTSRTAICDTGNLFDFSPQQYKKFVSNHKDFQRSLSIIKATLIDNYTG